jgi:hypothetical protein
MRLLSAILVGATALAAATPALGSIRTFEAYMDGLQETPPNASPATGYAALTLDDVTGQVTITTGTFSGLLASATAVHIHGLAGPGTPAGVLIPLTIDTPGTSGTFSGGGTLAGANITGMINGQTYVNLHTSVFPGGEVRGQLIETPEPASLAVLGIGASALLLHRRRAHRT